MKATINPGSVHGLIAAPPSKSMTQRVYAAALLHRGKTTIHKAGNSADETAALHIIQQLGAGIIQQTDNTIVIESNGVAPVAQEIDCGESGLSARLFIPIASLSHTPITITGKGSLLTRPMGLFNSVLPLLHVEVTSNTGCLPVQLRGPLMPANIKVDGSESSQFLSGLLFAMSYAQQQQEIRIDVAALKSKPYIDMTLDVLKTFGCNVIHENYKVFHVQPHAQAEVEKNISVTIAGDWSSAAYFLVAGAITGDIMITGLANDTLQADSAIFALLRHIGADIAWTEGGITVKQSLMSGFEFDATDCPDLFPALAILAACCQGESYITGIHRLFHKESNRAQSISEMLENFNVPFSIEEDALCITGVRKLQGTVIDAHNDHRMVMAAAIGALRANSQVDIMGAEAVNKSYPDFFKDLILCGGNCTFNIQQ